MFDTNLISSSRHEAALKKEMTPLRINKEDACAMFAGSSGDIYETTLDECACADFAIQGRIKPCKHMLRLAMELNKIPSDGMQTDIESAKAKYYIGKSRQFVKEAAFPDFIQFAKEFIQMYVYENTVNDGVLVNALDLSTIEDFVCFKFSKNGKAKVQKKWKKDFDSILKAIEQRLGERVVYMIADPDFVAMLCKED